MTGLLCVGSGACTSLSATDPARIGDARDGEPAAFVETIPGSPTTIEMLPVPRPPGAEDPRPLYMGRTEIPWEVYDAFVLSLDRPEDGSELPPGVDAVARPSEPYISVDGGFGHAGWPALSVSLQSARTFCEWLSAHTGRSYRLPTSAEWRHVCATGTALDDDGNPLHLKERAWYRRNADRESHPVGTRAPNRYGLHDMLGSVAEWCEDESQGPAIWGGSWRDGTDDVTCDSFQVETRAWNATDPQIPKSAWWLADGDFLGFRVVCDGEPPGDHAERDDEGDPERDEGDREERG